MVPEPSSLLIALGVRRDGQKVVLAIKNMGGESEAAWRAVLDDLTARATVGVDSIRADTHEKFRDRIDRLQRG